MTCSRDDYYTPTVLADKLASLIIEDGITTVVDFCVGDGDLLKAVKNRFPHINCYGTDISEESISILKKTHRDWILGVCDFTNIGSITDLQGVGDRKYDLIVLNPPFTCKGSSIFKINFDGIDYNVSKAMLFVANALNFRANNGVLYAILPSSCAHSKKDVKFWTYLRENYNLQVLETPERRYWHNCSASIILVSIGGRLQREFNMTLSTNFSALPVIDICRGHISPHVVKFAKNNSGVRYIHTTNMQSNCIVNYSRICLPYKRNDEHWNRIVISGPAVLIPRVCNPNKSKICVYRDKELFVPSDCVIVLSTKSIKDAIYISDFLCEHWSQFKTIYQGTAAKYTTIERVLKIFGKV